MWSAAFHAEQYRCHLRDKLPALRLIVTTTLLHRRETEQIREKPPTELRFDWEPDV